LRRRPRAIVTASMTDLDSATADLAQGPPLAPEVRARLVLVASLAFTAVLYLVPWLRLLAWPFRLVSTLAHELGHGLAAVLVGGDFEALLMWSDASGVAAWSAQVGRLGHAAIAAGGLVGPALASAVCFLLGRSRRWARLASLGLGIGLLIADLVVVRTLFGVVFVGLLAAVLILVSLVPSEWLAQVALVLLGVQLALSVFSRADYLFTRQAVTTSGTVLSDVSQMAEALILPYWFWGACCGAFSLAVLLAALILYLRAPQRAEPGL